MNPPAPTERSKNNAPRDHDRHKQNGKQSGGHNKHGNNNRDDRRENNGKNGGNRQNRNSNHDGNRGELNYDSACTTCSDIHYLHIISQNVNPNTILTSYFSQDAEGVKAPLNALVDTGALQGNYMNQPTFEKLSSMGVVSEDISIKVCAAFNECQTSNFSVTILLHFNVNNEHKLKSFSVPLSFSVLHTLPYDLIIGRQSINKYDLWNKTLVVDTTMFQPVLPARLRRLKSATKTSKKPTRTRKPLRALSTVSERQTKNQLHLQNTVETPIANESRPSDVVLTTRTAEVEMATSLPSIPPYRTVDASRNKGLAALYANERVEITSKTRIPLCCKGTKCRCPWPTKCDEMSNQPVSMRDASPEAVSSENHLSTNPRLGTESHRGELGAELPVAAGSSISYAWEATSTEQLLAFLAVKSTSDGAIRPPTLGLKSNRYRDTNLSGDVNRAHISELIHYEGEAEGNDTPASDLPRFQWDTEYPDLRPERAHANNGRTKDGTSETNYIPTRIFGTPTLVEGIKHVCRKHIKVFNTCLGANPAKVKPMVLEVDERLWCNNSNKGPARNQTWDKSIEIQKQVDKMLVNQIISPSKAEHYSQVHLVPKPTHTKDESSAPDESARREANVRVSHAKATSNISSEKTGWRFCIDFRRLNLVSKGVGWPIPNIREMMQRLGACRSVHFGKFDLTSGYFQAPLAMDSRIFTAFITHSGVYEFNRIAMGIKGAGSWFQAMIAGLLIGLLYIIGELYIDEPPTSKFTAKLKKSL